MLIDNINSPEDLKKLSIDQLAEVCQELREFIISNLSENPGHLGSSLGVIELTTAIHYVYNSPYDNIVWDVGHQAYAHKILTGRKDLFYTNRKYGGLSGFPKRSESKHDSFGGGHSSVSISAALGMDVASGLKGQKSRAIAVIGDGAMSGGLAFEGLNNAGVLANDLLVILNDNEISIDPNVGALKEYLLNMTTSKRYNRFKNKTRRALDNFPRIKAVIDKMVYAVKVALLQRSNLFESLNFRYFGPIDGHDVVSLIRVLDDMKHIKGAKLLHVITKKGKGYKPAEDSQTTWHAPGMFNMKTGERENSGSKSLRYQDVFGYTLLELAQKNDNIVGITPAMPTGCSMNIMQEVMPDRVFDVGIAEGHAVTFSAGLAAKGMIPFCNIYSSFMQRAYDNVIHDLVLQGLDAILCVDRAGIVGEDGSTHHGAFDIAYFRAIPNIIVSSPLNENELRNLMYTAQKGGHGPFVIRYPRGNGVLEDWRNPMEEIPIGISNTLKDGDDIAVLTIGHVGNYASRAIARVESDTGLSVKHIDLRFVKPLDVDMLHSVGSRFKKVITVEDGVVTGGMGSAVLEFFNDNGYSCRVKRLGIPDYFVTHGKISELLSECGYDEDGIFSAITEFSYNDQCSASKRS